MAYYVYRGDKPFIPKDEPDVENRRPTAEEILEGYRPPISGIDFPKGEAPCGTPHRYALHRVNGEEIDEACRKASAKAALYYKLKSGRRKLKQ